MIVQSDKLLDINPDELFKNHSISELQNVQRQIQTEIEKKREELRSTVGEKYRDLLIAADTISDMRETARSVVTCIADVSKLCQALQEKHLIGLKSVEPIPSNTRPALTSDEISKVLEIKLLLTMPERIWTAIDEKEFAFSAELFNFSAHIHLGLQVSRAIEKYPLAATQWNAILLCRQAILDASFQELRNISLPMNECADCLTVILLLEPKSMYDVMEEYLQLRLETFRKVLKSDEQPTVKDKLRAALLLVQHTLLVVAMCFLDNDSKVGLLEEKLSGLTGECASPTISKITPISPLAEQHLSQLIKDFKCSTAKPVKSLSANTVRSSIQNWLKMLKKSLEEEMSNLLGLIGNLRGIIVVRDEVSKIKDPTDWVFVENVLGPTRLTTDLIDPHVSSRSFELVSGVLRSAVTAAEQSLLAIDEEITKEGRESVQSETNIRWFLWKETEKDEVSLQTRGFTPRVANLCRSLDNQLKLLLDDVTAFLENVPNKEPLLNFLSLCTFETIERFTKGLISSIRANKKKTEASIIIRGRILQALSSRCPHLKKCVHQNDASTKTWSDMMSMLSAAPVEVWRLWKEFITPQLAALVKDKLDPDVAITTFLLSRPACETVTITEEAEDEKSVTSVIRVPSQPTFTLQELLLQVCLRVNAVGVHTLPRIIHLELIEVIAGLILSHYKLLSENEKIYQSQCWQMLMDVRFVTLLLQRENQTISQEVCDRLEGLIDPFDLKVCYPYLQANVRKSATRLQGTFGVLVDFSEKLAVLNSLKVAPGPQSNSLQDDPNVLALASGLPWIPLLPLTSGTSKKKEESPSKKSSTVGKGTKKESYSRDFVKSAGAFLGWS